MERAPRERVVSLSVEDTARCWCGLRRAEHDTVARDGRVVLVASGCGGFAPAPAARVERGSTRLDRAEVARCAAAVAAEVSAILGFTGPAPRFEVVARLGARWVGRCKWWPSRPTCVIQLQAASCADSQTLRRVVAHEVVHHVMFMRHGAAAGAFAHGFQFVLLADVVNAALGAGFITTRCDDTYVHGDTVRPYYLLLSRRASGTIGVSWFSRRTVRVDQVIAACRVRFETRVVETRDGKWASFPRAATGRQSSPSGLAYTQELEALFAAGEPAVADSVAAQQI